MAARPRERVRRDWPTGLREPRPGYFTWRNPESGKELAIGRIPLAQAKRQVLEALDYLASGSPTLLERISGKDNTIAELLKQMPVSEKYNTAKSNRSLDKKINEKEVLTEMSKISANLNILISDFIKQAKF